MTKQEIKKITQAYYKVHGITAQQARADRLRPLYVTLNGFSHTVGFCRALPQAGQKADSWASVGYSGYMSEHAGEQKIWGYENEHQKNLAKAILGGVPHYCYQNNAQQIVLHA